MYLPVAVERWGRVMLRGGRETRERERRKSFDLTLHRNTDQVGFAMHYMSLKLYCISLTTSRLAESTTYLHCKYHSTVLLSNSTTSKQDLLWLRKKSHHCDFSLRGTATQKTSRDRGAYPVALTIIPPLPHARSSFKIYSTSQSVGTNAMRGPESEPDVVCAHGEKGEHVRSHAHGAWSTR